MPAMITEPDRHSKSVKDKMMPALAARAAMQAYQQHAVLDITAQGVDAALAIGHKQVVIAQSHGHATDTS